jgi:broad specificity phosphatase PhoE
MALYLVRHGETDWNREKRFQSRTDVPLNEHGLAQARAIRDVLRERNISFIAARSSPLSRAVLTARIILEGTDTELVVEPAFIELEFGEFEGQLETDLKARFGESFSRWRASHYTQPPPGGGEDIISGAVRVETALNALKSFSKEGDVLIVAHQAVLMAMKAAITGRTDVDSALDFKQSNDEVEIWDMNRALRCEKFSVNTSSS